MNLAAPITPFEACALLLAYLKLRPGATIDELYRATGLHHAVIVTNLLRMQERGEVTVVGPGDADAVMSWCDYFYPARAVPENWN